MKLVLDVPAGWRTDASGTWTLLTSPDNKARVEVTPLLSPGDLDVSGVYERAVIPPGSVRYVQLLEDATTRDGWPMRLATLCVVHDGVEGEWRIGAGYTMLSWTAAVVARVKTRAAFDALRPTLLELLGSARPDLWADEPSCVAELFWGPR